MDIFKEKIIRLLETTTNWGCTAVLRILILLVPDIFQFKVKQILVNPVLSQNQIYQKKKQKTTLTTLLFQGGFLSHLALLLPQGAHKSHVLLSSREQSVPRSHPTMCVQNRCASLGPPARVLRHVRTHRARGVWEQAISSSPPSHENLVLRGARAAGQPNCSGSSTSWLLPAAIFPRGLRPLQCHMT